MDEDSMPSEPSDDRATNNAQERMTTHPSADPVAPASELQDLRFQVHGVHKFQKGLTAFFAIVAVFAAIVISFLGWLGISGTIDRNVEERVQVSVDKSIAQVISDLDSRLEQANNAAATSENAALRAESQSSA